MAADNYFVGLADDVKQVTTIPASGTFAQGQTVTVTCNGKNCTVTLGTDYATTDVVAVMEAAINAPNETSGILGSETRNIGGQSQGEFKDFVASSSASTLTLTSVKAGVPFTVTASTSGAGTFDTPSNDTAATGKNHFDAAANWRDSDGAAGSMAAGEPIILDSGNTDIKYGLDNTTNDFDLRRKSGYTGNIGLPKYNNDHPGYPYLEYRQRLLDLPITADTGVVEHRFGEPAGGAVNGITRVDFGTNDPTFTSGSLTVNAYHAGQLEIVGGHDFNLNAWAGEVEIGNDGQQTASEINDIVMYDGGGKGPSIVIGESTTFTNAATGDGFILQENGSLVLMANHSGDKNEYRIRKGSLIVGEGVIMYQLSMYTGHVDWRGETITNLYLYGGEFDTTACGSQIAGVGSTFEVYDGAIYRDPYNLFASVINLIGCNPSTAKLHLKDNLQITIGDASSATVIA